MVEKSKDDIVADDARQLGNKLLTVIKLHFLGEAASPEVEALNNLTNEQDRALFVAVMSVATMCLMTLTEESALQFVDALRAKVQFEIRLRTAVAGSC